MPSTVVGIRDTAINNMIPQQRHEDSPHVIVLARISVGIKWNCQHDIKCPGFQDPG